MTLYLCETEAITRIARELEARDAAPAAVETLPRRMLASAATAGSAVERHRPDVVVVLGLLGDGHRDRVGVGYRVTVAGESWTPDVGVRHDLEALSLSDEPGRDEERVSRVCGAAFSAALSLLSPHRVLLLVSGTQGVETMISRAPELAAQLERIGEHMRRRREGDEPVAESVRLGGEIADRLRLTATQRARFLQRVRSAAVRGGTVPAPLGSDVQPASSKQATKRRLAELERSLDEWNRAGV